MITEIHLYETSDGNTPFHASDLSLNNPVTRSRIRTRLNRILLGNYGDCEPIGLGVYELKFHFGPGYRVYFGRDGAILVLLLGGDKSSQNKDIQRAKEFWLDYIRRDRETKQK